MVLYTCVGILHAECALVAERNERQHTNTHTLRRITHNMEHILYGRAENAEDQDISHTTINYK